MKFRQERRRRGGSILVLTAVIMVLMFALLAFAVDLGYVSLVRTQMQSSADAAALAAGWVLYENRSLTPDASPELVQGYAKQTARYYAWNNPAGQTPLQLEDADITFGRLDLTVSPLQMTFDNPSKFNAVQVRIRRSAENPNGEVPTFFARVAGVNSFPSQAEATAVFLDNFKGFQLPADGDETQPILPFALDLDTWLDLQNGNCEDNWTWNEQEGTITRGADGIQEVNLFPQGTGSPGNRGTVDVGNPNNSTRDLSRQIVEGVNANDLSYLGGKLELGDDGTLSLNGDTGISAGMKNELASIAGKPRVIPLFSTVSGNGNNAQYTIVGFAGVRVMEVNLTGKMANKRVIIQPAPVQVKHVIPADDSHQMIYNIYSPVWLVR